MIELSEEDRGTPNASAALRTRILIVEAALRCIEQEADKALDDPELLLTALCRIAAIARQAAR